MNHRDHLSVCVADETGAPASVEQLVLVEAELRSLTISAIWQDDFGEPEVVAGCPPPSAFSGPPLGEPHPQASRTVTPHDVGERAVFFWRPAAPSVHKIFVYFVPRDTLAEYFDEPTYSEGRYALVTAELYCEGDNCAAVTGAMYVPPSTTTESVQQGLLDSLGLLPSAPDPALDLEDVEEPRRREIEGATP